MNRFPYLLGLAVVLWLGIVALAYAANRTPTPIVPPTETGEWDAMQQQVVDMARFKPGQGTGTCAISASACAVTVNNASGIVSVTAATAGASGTTQSVMTVTDNKVQVGDAILCSVDQSGATAGAVITCLPHITGAGTFTINLADASVTALTSSTLTVWFLVMTAGNPN
jgi:hypothetical protein